MQRFWLGAGRRPPLPISSFTCFIFSHAFYIVFTRPLIAFMRPVNKPLKGLLKAFKKPSKVLCLLEAFKRSLEGLLESFKSSFDGLLKPLERFLTFLTGVLKAS